MNKYIVCLTIVFCFLFSCPLLYGQKMNYQQFTNIYLGPETSATCCFLQDSEGLIWIGSNKGLFSYDGYSTQAHFMHGTSSNTRIYCGVVVDSTYLYLGADNGILVYNYKTDRYETLAVQFPTDVRTLALQEDLLWIGTLNGLYTYHLKKKELQAIDAKKSRLPHSTIYSVIRTSDDCIYVGTYNGLCRYQPKTQTFETIRLPGNKGKNNLFVNSLLEDPQRSCIWIGTEGSLFKYTPQNHVTKLIEGFHDNSIKTLALDGDGTLLAGTDNGLYVYGDDSSEPQHIVHDSRNIQSLTNNIIWNLFTDAEHNVWLGTDYGISLSRYNSAFQIIPISQVTQIGDGNHFYSMFRDSHGYYWFGGTNGLLRLTTPAGGHKDDVAWYQMGSKSYPLAHNRIRHIYEDRDRQLWVATDGSVHRYDYGSKQFVNYNIVDSTGRYNSNWAYYLFEDKEGRLWISTCLGGIFVVDKKKLLASNAQPYVAEQNYSTQNGLSGMFINQIVPDREGNVWVLLYNNNGIDKIDTRTRKVTKMFEKELSGDHSPNYLLADKQGYLWIGFRGGVMRINPKDGSQHTLSFGTYGNDEILAMADVEGHIWVSTTNGLWTIEAQQLNVRQLNITDKRFTSLFFDPADRHIYLGGADGFAISQPDVLKLHRADRPIFLTAIYINNQWIQNHPGEEKRIIRYAHSIELNYKQNNLAFDVSDLPYSLEEKNKFVYQLHGMDKDWNYLKPNSNRITYSNLHYGDYRLIIKRLNSYGVPSEDAYTLDIHINPPWYYTIWAKTLYFLLSIVLIVWTINFFRVKSRLKQERKEKEKILEQSRSKIDFFTHLSNELKTPLSRIIAPVSKLIPGVNEASEKQTLEEVQQNALKINSLLHQMLDFGTIADSKDSLLILSRIEVVSFARSLFSLYRENAGAKMLTFHFEANVEHVYADMDAIKLGVMLNNLLSNAVKFTPKGGTVGFSLEYEKEMGQLDISISDTGIGIPPQDIPYIFQRYFQSPHTGMKKEGTGMGLYLVKVYTELHGGCVSVASSVVGQGSMFKLAIPVVEVEERIVKEVAATEEIAVDEEGTVAEEGLKAKDKGFISLRPIEVESQDEKFLNKIIHIIEDHISDSDLNVNALCELSDMSNKQIYRKIKQMTGMTPVEYIKTIRMKKAAMLLQQKKFTVAEVMYMVGFSNHSYFSKCFQAEFGKTPKEYIHE